MEGKNTHAEFEADIALNITLCLCLGLKQVKKDTLGIMNHRPLHHFDIKAEALIDGVGFPPNTGLELEHLWLIQDEAILKDEHTHKEPQM